MGSSNLREKLKELLEKALEYDIVTENEDSLGYMFENELIGETQDAVLDLLEKDHTLLDNISEQINEYEYEDDDGDEYEEADCI